MLVHPWFSISSLTPQVATLSGDSTPIPRLFAIGEPGHSEEVFSFLLVGEERGILVDSGMGLFPIKQVVEQIAIVDGQTLPVQVLNTHADFDHVGGNSAFDEIALLDHPISRRIASDGYLSNDLAEWVKDDQFRGRPPEGIAHPYQITSFPHATFFADGERLVDATFDITAIHTPGHTDDSVSFFERNNGWLFVGDLIYSGPIYLQKEGGLAKYRRSLERLLELTGVTRLFCSHTRSCEPVSVLQEVYEGVMRIGGQELVEEVVVGEGIWLVPVDG